MTSFKPMLNKLSIRFIFWGNIDEKRDSGQDNFRKEKMMAFLEFGQKKKPNPANAGVTENTMTS